MWDCRESQNIWKLYNETLEDCSLNNLKIKNYENIYETESVPAVSIIKTKIIQEFIQIKRPQSWKKCNIVKLIINLRNMEMHNAKQNYNTNKTEKKWKHFQHLNTEE